MIMVKLNGWAGRAKPDDFMLVGDDVDEKIDAKIYSENGRDIIAEISGESLEKEAGFANQLYDFALMNLVSRGHAIHNLDNPVRINTD